MNSSAVSSALAISQVGIVQIRFENLSTITIIAGCILNSVFLVRWDIRYMYSSASTNAFLNLKRYCEMPTTTLCQIIKCATSHKCKTHSPLMSPLAPYCPFANKWEVVFVDPLPSKMRTEDNFPVRFSRRKSIQCSTLYRLTSSFFALRKYFDTHF
jgi:hypothetical protein